jgi:hypothetical protein
MAKGLAARTLVASRLKFSVRAAAILLAAFAGACAHQRGAALEPVAASSVTQRIEILRDVIRRGGVSSFAKLRFSEGGKTRSINARISIDHDRLRVDLLSPLGTTAATIDLADDQVLWLDRIDQSYWKGTREELQRDGGGGSIGDALLLRDAAPLLVGALPDRDAAACNGEASQQCLDYGAFRAAVALDGLVSAEANGWSAHFEPAAFPAQNVAIDLGSRRLQIEHLEVRRIAPLTPLEIPSGYRCCQLPALPQGTSR